MHQDAEVKAAAARAKAMAEARSVSEHTLKGDRSLQISYADGKMEMESMPSETILGWEKRDGVRDDIRSQGNVMAARDI